MARQQRYTGRESMYGAALSVAMFALGGCSSEPIATADVDNARGMDDEESTEPEGDEEGEERTDAQPEAEREENDDVAGPIDAGSVRADASSPSLSIRDAQASDASRTSVSDASAGRDAALEGAGGSDAALAERDASTPSERMDLGKGDGRDVITIGDSWMRFLLTGIETGLVKASGQRYRQYGVLGTKLLDGVIPGQYRSAKRDDPDIKTVVMTGGGNDVIQSTLIEASCRDGTQLCEQQLNEIRQALAELWAQMSKDGVQDVVHVMYSKSAASAVKNRDAHNAKLAETCAAVPPPLRCHMLNTDMLIRATDLRLDGIHPDDAGYDRIGKAVFDLMVEEGMRR